MGRRKYLTKKQLSVLEDLFSGDLNEQEVLLKHKLSKNIYNKWLSEERFAELFSHYINGLKRQSELLISRYATLAAVKLVDLTESENQETARKACLDIISFSLAKKMVSKANGDVKGVKEADKKAMRLPTVLVQRELDKSVSQLRDFSCSRQI